MKKAAAIKGALCAVVGAIITVTMSQAGLAASFTAGVVAYDNGLYEEAARIWFRVADKSKAPAAQFNLGLLYEQGLGVDKSLGLAARYYLAAANQGYAPAQYNLAVLHHEGEGVVKSAREAVHWWSKAAQQGHADAQYALGVLLLKGDTIPGHRTYAEQWLTLAARRGHEAAADLLSRLTRPGANLDPTRFAEIDPATRGATSSRPVTVFSDIDWIFRRSAANFTVQLHQTDSAREAEAFIIDHGISDVATYYRRGEQYAIIAGEYERKQHAETAIANLTPNLRRLAPRIRTFASVHEDIESGERDDNR